MEQTVHLFGVISPWWNPVNSYYLSGLLSNLKSTDTLVVKINSSGGDVFEGFAIYNLLKDAPVEVVIKIIGVAASAASIIACAGNKVLISETANYLAHNPWVWSGGDAIYHRKVADNLDSIKKSIVDTYVRRTGKTESEMSDLMNEDKLMTTKEALAWGFVDKVYIPGEIEEKEDQAVMNASMKFAAMIKGNMNNSIESINNIPSNNNGDNMGLQEDFNALTIELGTFKSKYVQLEKDFEASRAEIAGLNSRISEKDERITTLEAENKAQKEELEPLKAANAELEAKNTEAEIDNILAENKDKVLPKEKVDLRAKLLALKAAGDDLKVGDKTMFDYEVEQIKNRKSLSALGQSTFAPGEEANFGSDAEDVTEAVDRHNNKNKEG